MGMTTATVIRPGEFAHDKARDPAKLKKVQVGDLVDITYSEALAIAVRPVNKK